MAQSAEGDKAKIDACHNVCLRKIVLSWKLNADD